MIPFSDRHLPLTADGADIVSDTPVAYPLLALEIACCPSNVLWLLIPCQVKSDMSA